MRNAATTRRARAGLRVSSLALVVALWLASGALAAQAPGATVLPEYVVKAAFLYNFALFVEWPSSAFASERAPFVVGIVGADPFGPEIDRTLAHKQVKGRPITVRRLAWGPELRDCHMLFVSASVAQSLPSLPRLLKGAHVLTVGDAPSSARRGAIVAFVTAERRVGLEVNIDRAADAELTISSKVLQLAQIRRGGEE